MTRRQVPVSYTHLDVYKRQIQTRMASSDLPDIANCSNIDDASLVALGQNGTIQELGSAIAQYSNCLLYTSSKVLGGRFVRS